MGTTGCRVPISVAWPSDGCASLLVPGAFRWCASPTPRPRADFSVPGRHLPSLENQTPCLCRGETHAGLAIDGRGFSQFLEYVEPQAADGTRSVPDTLGCQAVGLLVLAEEADGVGESFVEIDAGLPAGGGVEAGRIAADSRRMSSMIFELPRERGPARTL